MWRELWWKMAEGKNSEYEGLKKTNVFEFYNLLSLWKEKTKKDNERIKNQNAKR